MDFLHLISKTIHIACGALVLILGLLQMILPKRGKLHTRMGTLYFYLMIIIFFTSLPPAVYYGNWFLACVSVFALYLVWTGKRYGYNKGNIPTSLRDKFITFLGFLSGVGMIILVGLFFLKGEKSMAIVPLVFGFLLLRWSYEDFKYYFLRKTNPRFGKMHWHFQHLSRMIGSYIGAITAFLVNVQPFGEGLWISWIAPTLIGGIVIALMTRYYASKFNLVKNKQ